MLIDTKELFYAVVDMVGVKTARLMRRAGDQIILRESLYPVYTTDTLSDAISAVNQHQDAIEKALYGINPMIREALLADLGVPDNVSTIDVTWTIYNAIGAEPIRTVALRLWGEIDERSLQVSETYLIDLFQDQPSGE